MDTVLHIPLNADAAQRQRLQDLQKGFARVCNALAPLVQQTRVWNRVALHHLAYRQLREQFPEMGSQMVCNAIYSVSRAGRLVYQHPQSQFNSARMGDKPLPLLRFADNCPVYFDRHTLSVKAGQLSMFTLDGRMRFQLALGEHDEARFHAQKLREIVLSRRADGAYELAFLLGGVQAVVGEASAVAAVAALPPLPAATAQGVPGAQSADAGEPGEIPDYIEVEEVQ